MNLEQQGASLVKWLVDEKRVKLKTAYYISARKFKLKNIDGIRKEYQKIKKIVKNQLSLI